MYPLSRKSEWARDPLPPRSMTTCNITIMIFLAKSNHPSQIRFYQKNLAPSTRADTKGKEAQGGTYPSTGMGRYEFRNLLLLLLVQKFMEQ